MVGLPARPSGPRVRPAAFVHWTNGPALPPADRLDDFYLVAWLEDVRVMECARDELLIDFYGNPAPFERHLGN